MTKTKGIFMNLNKLFAFMFALISSIFVACSDSKVAGGSSDDAGIIAERPVCQGLCGDGTGNRLQDDGIDGRALRWRCQERQGRL